MSVQVAIAGILLILGIALFILKNFGAETLKGAAKALAAFLITFAVLSAISWVGIQIDLFFNSFLREMQPRWWYMFTSYHGPAIMWLFYRPVFFVITAIGTAILDLVLYANFAN